MISPGHVPKRYARPYSITKKTASVIKAFCSRENFAHKYQMSGFTAAGKPVDWPNGSQKCNIYTSEEGMYELLFSSQQSNTKDFRRHCCNVLFPHLDSNLVIRYMRWKLKILKAVPRPLSLQMKKNARSIKKPTKNMRSQLHCSMMIYRNDTTGYRPSSIRT